jgi:iron only hydrogenase large subunit-like protein
MEATLRTACELITGVAPEKIEFTQVRAVEGLREAELNLAGKTVRVGVANGLNNAKILLDLAKENPGRYHVLEVMACPGGCIGGGGQPYPPNNTDVLDPELLRLRAQALYTIDGAKKLRKSHENPAVKKLYTDMLGEPGSEIAHKLLHTEYHSKLPRGIR